MPFTTTDIEVQAVTIDTAAKLLSLSRSKLYLLVSSGEIPSFKVGRSRRLPLKGIADFQEQMFQSN